MRVFHALNIVYNLNPRAEAGHWRNNTKGEKSAQKGGFQKLHTDLRGDGERATVSIAGRGTEHSWRKKSGAVGSMVGTGGMATDWRTPNSQGCRSGVSGSFECALLA